MSHTSYSVIVLEPLVGSMDTLVRVLEKSGQFELMRVPTHEEAYQVALQFEPCLLLVSILAGEDGAGELALLRRLEKKVRTGDVRVLTISGRKGHLAGRQTADFGDYMEEPVPMKGLLFKVKLLMKALNARQGEQAGPGEEKVFKADGKEEAAVSEVPANFVPALQLGEDTFLFKNARPRLHGHDVVLEAEGPLPETGAWIEEEDGDSWRWVDNTSPEGEPRADDGNGWIHRGKKPAYQPSKGKWELRSGLPELSYRRDGKIVATRVKLAGTGRVEIAEDSQAARDNLILNRTQAVQARARLIQQIVGVQKDAEEATGPAGGQEENVGQPPASAAAGSEDPVPPDGKVLPDAGSEKARRALRRRLEARKASGNPPHTASASKAGTTAVEAGLSDDALTEEPAEEGEGKDAGTEVSPLLRGLERQERRKKAARDAATARVDGDVEPAAKRNVPKADPESGPGETPGGRQSDRDPEDVRDPQLHREALPRKKHAQKTKRENAASTRARETDDEQFPESSDEPASRASEVRKERDEKNAGNAERAETSGRNRKGKKAPAAAAEVELAAEQMFIDSDSSESAGRAALARAEARRAHALGVNGSEGVSEEHGNHGLYLGSEPTRAASDLQAPSPGKERSFRAIESLTEQGGMMGVEKITADVRAKEARKEFFLSTEEVQPSEGIWIEAEGQFAYLPSEALDNGFHMAEELLPLWVFEGRDSPELIGSRWRFLDTPPRLVESVAELPKAVREALSEIHAQAALALGHEPAPLSERTSRNLARRSLPADGEAPLHPSQALFQEMQSDSAGHAHPEAAQGRNSDPENVQPAEEEGELDPLENPEAAQLGDAGISPAASRADGPPAVAQEHAAAEQVSPPSSMPLAGLLALAFLSDLRRLSEIPAESFSLLAGLLTAAIPSRVITYSEKEPTLGTQAIQAGSRGWLLVRPVGEKPLSIEEESLLHAAKAALPARAEAA